MQVLGIFANKFLSSSIDKMTSLETLLDHFDQFQIAHDKFKTQQVKSSAAVARAKLLAIQKLVTQMRKEISAELKQMPVKKRSLVAKPE